MRVRAERVAEGLGGDAHGGDDEAMHGEGGDGELGQAGAHLVDVEERYEQAGALEMRMSTGTWRERSKRRDKRADHCFSSNYLGLFLIPFTQAQNNDYDKQGGDCS